MAKIKPIKCCARCAKPFIGSDARNIYCSPSCAARMSRRKTDLRLRFWTHVSVSDDDHCWLWKGHITNHGYGGIGVDRKKVQAHRIAWILTNGPIPTDTPHVLHRCDVRSCVNPKHLFVGTAADNIADMVAKGRNRNGKCEGARNPSSKLSEAQVMAIRNAHGTQEDIGRTFGISQSQVSSIRTFRTWSHL